MMEEGSLNIIAAFSNRNFGIGHKNKIPWQIHEDLAHFSKVTKDSVCVMGRNTWESIPESKRPLKYRLNVIVSSTMAKGYVNGAFVILVKDLDFACKTWLNAGKDVFIIGGEEMYRKFVGKADRIYATLVDKIFECDTYFPVQRLGEYTLDKYSENFYSDEEKCNYRFVEYNKTEEGGKMHGEKVYLELMKTILENGNMREDRTGTGTNSIFGSQMRFDISESIPILTTKFVPFQLTVKEALFFLKGQTDVTILQKQGVHIWDGNSTKDFQQKRGLGHYEEYDIGPMYGFIQCHIGAEYKGCKHDYTGEGIHQLQKLVAGLKDDPWSRRHLMTSFCPTYVDQGVLPPCHSIVSQFYVTEKNGKKYLSSHFYSRSADGFLGLPISILSHSILTYIIAKMCDFLPYELIISIGDAHLYSNHLDKIQLQLDRPLLPFPKLILNDSVRNKDFKDIEVSDFTLVGYLHGEKISAQMAI